MRGFTDGITAKAVGFNAHIQVSDLNSIRGKEAGPILDDQEIYTDIKSTPGVKHVQTYINKQSIIETDEGLSGVFVKGFAKDFYWDFFKENLVEGDIVPWDDSTASNKVIISKTIADKLDIHIGDKITFYFIRGEDDFAPRKMKVHGLFNTDMVEFDERFVLMDIRHLQKVNDWGLEIQALTDNQCLDNRLKLEVFTYGGDGNYRLDWSDGFESSGNTRFICPAEYGKENPLWVALSDNDETLPDTAFIHFDNLSVNNCGCDGLTSYATTSGGTRNKYINGYEVYLDDFKTLDEKENALSDLIGNTLNTTNVLRQSPEIFSWLELIDLNVYIIIFLLLGVAIINMSSALIINILERTQLIGVLKSLGANNWSIRKVFLIHAARLIAVGLILGNIIGLGLGWLQMKYSFLKLDPNIYSLSEVPIKINWSDVLILDLGTIVVCVLALIIPSYLITRISPVQAIAID